MRYLLKNKLFIILLVFFFALLLFSISSFANTDMVYKNGAGTEVTFSLPDEYFTSTYHFIYEFGKEDNYVNYYVVYGDYHLVFVPFNGSPNPYVYFGYFTTGSSDKLVNVGYYYGSVNDTSPVLQYGLKHDLPLSSCSGDISSFVYNSIYDLNYIVYYINSEDAVFYPAPPQEETSQVELMKEMQQVGEILPKMLEIVKMILPVCLIVFGTLLVVYLIKYKNLLNL